MKLLYVNCCISVNEKSRTQELADAFISAWKEENIGATTETVNLTKLDIKPLTAETIKVREKFLAEKPGEQFRLARQFAQADKIVISAPFWDLSFPSKLRVYLEHVSANGITFKYENNSIKGLCKADKILMLTSASGHFDEAKGESYLNSISKMFDIENIFCISAPMQDAKDVDGRKILDDAIEEARKLAKEF